MILKEFRIPMPVSVDELYSVVEASRQNTNADTGVEILVNEPYTNERGTGQFTHKVYHMGSKMPRIVRALLPESAKIMIEKAWNEFPYCRTEFSNPFLGERFSVIVESRHLPDDGSTENAHNLSPDELKIRQVQFLNIAADQSSKPTEHDPSTFHSTATGRGPLAPGWVKAQTPIMCCYKLVTVKFQVFGFQTRIESIIDQGQIDLMLDFHKQIFCSIDSWHHLSMEDIRELEAEAQREVNARMALLHGVSAEPNTSTSTNASPSTMASYY